MRVDDAVSVAVGPVSVGSASIAIAIGSFTVDDAKRIADDAICSPTRSGTEAGSRDPSGDGLTVKTHGKVTLAAVAASVTAVLAVTMTACAGTPGRAGESSGNAGSTARQVVPPVSVSAAELARLPRATTYSSIPAAPGDVAPFTVTSGLVVHPLARQVLYAAPGKKAVAVLPTTELGGPTWVPVVQATPGWERVLLPSRPNRATGWIYTGAASQSSRLETRHSSYLVRVNLGSRQLSVYDGGARRGTWTVAVGIKATPTPTGRTFLLASLAPPHPTYSPLILPLGTHSSTLETYGGGPGTVGLHGWPDPSVFGHAVSHGCVRVPASALRVLSQVPLGSLVLVSGLPVLRSGLTAVGRSRRRWGTAYSKTPASREPRSLSSHERPAKETPSPTAIAR